MPQANSMHIEPPHVLSCAHRHQMDKNNNLYPHHLKETPSLLKEKTYLSRNMNSHASRVKTYKTPAGPLFLRTCCTPSFVEGLKADDGLRAFARLPEREHNLLLSIAQQPENRLTLAYTATGTIVGQ